MRRPQLPTEPPPDFGTLTWDPYPESLDVGGRTRVNWTGAVHYQQVCWGSMRFRVVERTADGCVLERMSDTVPVRVEEDDGEP